MLDFGKFSYFVDLALVWMRSQLESNKDISTYIEGGVTDDKGSEEVH